MLNVVLNGTQACHVLPWLKVTQHKPTHLILELNAFQFSWTLTINSTIQLFNYSIDIHLFGIVFWWFFQQKLLCNFSILVIDLFKEICSTFFLQIYVQNQWIVEEHQFCHCELHHIKWWEWWSDNVYHLSLILKLAKLVFFDNLFLNLSNLKIALIKWIDKKSYLLINLTLTKVFNCYLISMIIIIV